MQIHRAFLVDLVGLAAALLLVAGGAPQAGAAPDIIWSYVFAEDDGFPNVCTAPCFNVEKATEVWFAENTDPLKPPYCAPGEDTYVYTLTHLGGSLPPPNIPVTEFEGAVDDALVTAAGWDATVDQISSGELAVTFRSASEMVTMLAAVDANGAVVTEVTDQVIVPAPELSPQGEGRVDGSVEGSISVSEDEFELGSEIQIGGSLGLGG